MNIAFLSAFLALLTAGMIVAAAQAVQRPGPVLPAGAKKSPRSTQLAAVVPRPSPPVVFLSTNAVIGSKVWKVLERKGGKLEGSPAPGLYKTEPYSCLVLVPGPYIDEKSIIKPSLPLPPMPTVDPGLEFVPWPRPKALPKPLK
ncbi:MAG: hypothetical protein AB9869_02685 [Verrucomicrobiia bacterium]